MNVLFIAGMSKSGTTTLFKILKTHPQISSSTPKEPGFFNRDENFALGIEHYFSHFKKPEGKTLLDGTTEYSLTEIYPQTLSRIKSYVSNPKFVLIFRDPIDRAFSIAKHICRLAEQKGLNKSPILFTDLTESTDHKYDYLAHHYKQLPHKSLLLESGRYQKILDKFYTTFSKEQILLFSFEELEKDINEVVCTTLKFIGAEQFPEKTNFDSILFNDSNSGDNRLTKIKLSQFFRTFYIFNLIRGLIPKQLRAYLLSTLSSNTFLKSNIKINTIVLPDQKTIDSLREQYPNIDIKKYRDKLLTRQLL